MNHQNHSEHFSTTELQCHCGCRQTLMEAKFLNKLEALRVAFGKPMATASGYRCPSHNAAVSHTGTTGPHTTGKAIDIKVCGVDAYMLLLLAMQLGFSGLGVSQRGDMQSRFIHIDDLPYPDFPRPRIWSY